MLTAAFGNFVAFVQIHTADAAADGKNVFYKRKSDFIVRRTEPETRFEESRKIIHARIVQIIGDLTDIHRRI